MRILIFSHEFPPKIGGAGVVAKSYADQFSKRGFDVTVLTSCVDRGRGSDSYRHLSVFALRKLWFVFYLFKTNFNQYDLILLNDPPAIFFAGLFFTKKLLSRCVAFLHGGESNSVLKPSDGFRRFFGFRGRYLRALAYARVVVAVSNYMKMSFSAQCVNRCIRDKIAVLSTPVDRDIFFPEPSSDFRRDFGIPDDCIILLTVSRVVEKKGFLDMLYVFEKLISSSPDGWVWIVVGDGEFVESFKEIVEKKGLEGVVRLLGKMPRSELRRFYSNSSVFWLLSNFNESFGLVYLEAQACGCPAIGRRRAGAMEAIKDGETGFLVDSNDDCVRLLLGIQGWGLKRENLLSFSEAFDWSSNIKTLSSFAEANE